MRYSLLLIAMFTAGAAVAQVPPLDPVGISESPFQSQNPVGDGVRIVPHVVPTPAPTAVPAAAPALGMGLGKVFDEADTNRDDIVTRAEFLAKAERHFGLADSNKDGRITREEMAAQQQSIMQQVQKNLLGGGGTWQGKLNEVLGGEAPATGAVRAAPVVPVVTPPTPPTPPQRY